MSEHGDRLRTALADRYTIERELGAGGMATVYLAEDLKHKRKVAVKVLRPELAAVIGADRFLKEIEVTANLQHPNILPLYDSGATDTFLYYVMPFIEGESLRDKLDREKQLGVEEAVEIAKSVAAALAYSHERDVIHRDIKPENILLQAGQALVADFGIALAVTAAGGPRLTETGLSLGTPHYMSPEQATGERELGARSDVYSLGAVVYEMLVGDPPHTGSTVQAIVAKVLSEKPAPIRRTRALVPHNVDAAVGKALEKIPADRFETAAQFADALMNPAFAVPSSSDAIGQRPTAWSRANVTLVGIAAVLLATTLWGWFHPRGVAGPSVYDVALPDSAPISFKASTSNLPALAASPHGDFVVYVAARRGTTELWYRSLLDDTARPLAGTDDAFGPVLSPDGEWLAFFSGSQLKSMRVEGGPVTTVADVSTPAGARWVSDTRILIADDDGNMMRWLDLEAVEHQATEVYYCILPELLPEGERVLCGGGAIQYARVLSLGDGTEQYLLPRSSAGTAPLRGSDFRLVDGNVLVYMSVVGDIRAVPIDLVTLRVGQPVTMVPGVRRESYTGAGQYALTPAGTLVYALGANAEIGRLVKTRGADAPEPLPIEPAAFLRFELSPDGRRLAAVVQGVRQQELRIIDLASGQQTVWLREAVVGEPLWTPAGDRLLVQLGGAAGLVTVIGSPTAATPPDTILRHIYFSGFTFRSDRLILGSTFPRLQAVALDVSATPPIIDTIVDHVYYPALSPDSRWLSFQSSVTGQVLLQSYPAGDRRFQVADEGWEPQWRSRTELVYWLGNTWYRVRVSGVGDAPVDPPRPWFTDSRFSDTPGQSYELTPDGGVIYLQGPERTTGSYLRVIPNWVKQMKRAVEEANQ